MARQRRRSYNPDDQAGPTASATGGTATAAPERVGGGGVGLNAAYDRNKDAYTTNKDAYTTNKDAYGQTDVLHDPRWLRANIAARMSNDPSRMHTDPQLQDWAARLKALESGGAPRQLAQRRAQMASGGGARTASDGYMGHPGVHDLVDRNPSGANIQGVPLSADAIAGRPSPNAVTSTPQGQTLIGGPGRGYDPGQDARVARVTHGGGYQELPSGGTSGRPPSDQGPFRDPYGNRLPNVEAGTMGDPNKPGAHRVVITGPNSFETRQPIQWRDSEGVYGTKDAVYNTESVIGHRTPGDVHDYLHTHNDFYPNPDYHAARMAAGAAAAGIKPGEPDLGKVVGEAGVGDGDKKPEGRYLDKGGVMTPIENLTPQERVARGQGGFFDNLLHSPAAVKMGVPQTDEERGRFMPDTGQPGTAPLPAHAPSDLRYGAKPQGIDTLRPPPPLRGGIFADQPPAPAGAGVVPPPGSPGGAPRLQYEREALIPKPAGIDALVPPPVRNMPGVVPTGAVRMANETGVPNVMPNEGMYPTRAPVPDEAVGMPFRGSYAGGGNVPAGVSNRQAADIETPTNQNAIAKTETSPEMDINKSDQTTAPTGGNAGTPPMLAGPPQPGAPAAPPPPRGPLDPLTFGPYQRPLATLTPPPPPPPPPREDQYAGSY